MRKLVKDPSKGTRKHRQMLQDLATSIKQPAMTRKLPSHEERRAIADAAKTAAMDRIYGKHSARVRVNDGWQNFLTGLGMHGLDKRTANYAEWGLTLQENIAEDLFAADSLARRICEILPNDATREWIEFEKEDDKDPLTEEIERLQVQQRVNEAWIWARESGGAGIFINDGTPVERLKEPLRPDSLGRIISFTVLTRWELWAWATDIQRDISKPDFGLPLQYHIYPRMAFGQVALTVHASRIIRFDGKKLPRLLHIRNNFWGDSVLTPIYDALGDFRVSHHAVAVILQEINIMVHKISGLSEKIAAGGEAAIRARIEIMNMSKSVLGALLIDKNEDEIEFQTRSVQGVAALIEKVFKLLQALTDIPHSILFNEAPGGARSMGSSGDHEEKNWYNTVHAQQKTYLKPRLDELFKLIFAQKGGPFKGVEPKNWKYIFKPLWQMDDKETAETEYAEAQADQIYMQEGVKSPEQVQADRFPELTIDATSEQLEINKQMLQESLKKPETGTTEPQPQPANIPKSPVEADEKKEDQNK